MKMLLFFFFKKSHISNKYKHMGITRVGNAGVLVAQWMHRLLNSQFPTDLV